MFLLFNNQLLTEQELLLPITDRAFQYNDGFFETAIIADDRIRLWHIHLQRMQEAAEALRLELPVILQGKKLEEQLLQLAQQEKAQQYGRLKLKVWRAGAGLYTPQANNTNWLATIEPTMPTQKEPLHIGICTSTHTSFTPLSHIKGPNAPLYVLAGIEKQAQQQDDMLLLSPQGMVAELISSNIFWYSDGELHTPTLETGCVNGILRRSIISWCNSQNIPVREVQQAKEKLFRAAAVFSANVTGIRGIASIDGRAVAQREDLLRQLRQGIGI